MSEGLLIIFGMKKNDNYVNKSIKNFKDCKTIYAILTIGTFTLQCS